MFVKRHLGIYEKIVTDLGYFACDAMRVTHGQGFLAYINRFHFDCVVKGTGFHWLVSLIWATALTMGFGASSFVILAMWRQ